MELQERIRNHILGLPYVTLGRRFGGEAFFFRKRFFCHFHPAHDNFSLETFVWNMVDDVAARVPGVIRHPEYGNYGWVRLPILTEKDTSSAIKLIDITYRYLRTTKRVSIQQARFSTESLRTIRRNIPQLNIEVKEAKRTMQILMHVPDTADYDEAEKLIAKATRILRPHALDSTSVETRQATRSHAQRKSMKQSER